MEIQCMRCFTRIKGGVQQIIRCPRCQREYRLRKLDESDFGANGNKNSVPKTQFGWSTGGRTAKIIQTDTNDFLALLDLFSVIKSK